MPEILEIREFSDPILRSRAHEVGNAMDPAIQKLIEDMTHTSEKLEGLGIAAPQVGQPVRLFIVSSRPTPAYPDAPTAGPFVIINPVITEYSEEKVDGPEGCFSLPNIRAMVKRSTWVRTSFIDCHGKHNEATFEGFTARIFQHEIDHLNGISFMERADLKTIMTDNEHRKLTQAAARK